MQHPHIVLLMACPLTEQQYRPGPPTLRFGGFPGPKMMWLWCFRERTTVFLAPEFCWNFHAKQGDRVWNHEVQVKASIISLLALFHSIFSSHFPCIPYIVHCKFESTRMLLSREPCRLCLAHWAICSALHIKICWIVWASVPSSVHGRNAGPPWDV